MSSNLLHHKIAVWMRQPVGMPAGRDYLTQKHFTITIMAALALHMLAFYIWHLMPRTQVIDIPVRVLNIKLSDNEAADDKASQPSAANNNDVENTLSRLIHEQEQEAPAKPQAVEKPTLREPARSPSREVVRGRIDVRQEGVASAAPVMPVEASQFVRSTNAQANIKPTGTGVGNSEAKNAEIVSRYEQLISLWIQKFKIYPEEARKQGMQGETVVRIRIDRQGNIAYSILEHSTGFQLLDRAATDMVHRANPVPAVPTDYPAGDMFEFLIPVTFHLQ